MQPTDTSPSTSSENENNLHIGKYSSKCQELMKCIIPSMAGSADENKNVSSTCRRIRHLVQTLNSNGLSFSMANDGTMKTETNDVKAEMEAIKDGDYDHQRNVSAASLSPVWKTATEQDYAEEIIALNDNSIGQNSTLNMRVIPIECKECSTDPSSAESQCRAFVSTPAQIPQAANANKESGLYHAQQSTSSTAPSYPSSQSPLTSQTISGSVIDGIVLCTNRLKTIQELEEALLHELVHVHDAWIKKLDLRRCKELAYSEVRAAREAECNYWALSAFMKRPCVREKAKNATTCMFPGDQGKECVNQVFEEAFADLSGFPVFHSVPLNAKNKEPSPN